MTLTLRIRNVDRLDNGVPTEFLLNNRGAIIGRAATCDWSLPDPRNYISSRHAEVTFRDGFYFFNDISTNGTFLNGAGARMGEPRRIEGGDLFLIGQYEVEAGLSGAASVAVERQEQQAYDQAQQRGGFSWDTGGGAAPPPATPDRGGWGEPTPPANAGLASGAGGISAPLDGGWGAVPPPPAPSAPAGDGWGAAPAAPASDGWGAPPAPPESGGWGAPPTPPPASDGWGAPPAPPPASDNWGAAPAAPASDGWGAAPAPAPSGGDAGWGAPPPPSPGAWAPEPSAPAPAENAGWATPPEQPPSQWEAAPAPIQQASAWSSAVPDAPRAPTPNAVWGSMEESNAVDWGRAFGDQPGDAKDLLGLGSKPADALPAAPPPVTPAAPNTPAPSYTPPPPAAADMGAIAVAFGKAAGLRPEQLKTPSAETIERAANVMRRLVAGLTVMVEARARAKSQMGAEQTGLEFDGNNPIKFARTPDQALAQLLNPPERGFMPAEKAVEDAYFDLQSHQMATLKAMQGALRATLDRFSPAAIKRRAERGGFMARVLPGGRDATLWQTYEREFSGVSEGSDEAFMDVFAKEFRLAYDELSRNRNR